MAENDSELDNYYVIKFENFIELIKQTDAIYHIVANLLEEQTLANDTEEWYATAIPDLSGYFSIVTELKDYLDDIVNNPTEEEIKLIKKYNLSDILISIEDLSVLNHLLKSMQDYETRIYNLYKISTIVQ